MKQFLYYILFLLIIFPSITYAENTYTSNFNGSTQYFSISDASQTGLEPSDTMTVQFWIKFGNFPSNGNFVDIFRKRTSSLNKQYVIEFYNDGGTKTLLVYAFDNILQGNIGQTNGMTITNGVWYNFAITITASTHSIAVYKDGSAVTVNMLDSSGTNIQNADAPITIGGNVDGFLDGKIDELLFYNTNIGSTQVGNNYTTPCTPYSTGLVSQWQMENNANDNIGSNNLTNNNSITFPTDPAFTGCGGGGGSSTSTASTSTSTALQAQFYFATIIMYGILLFILGFGSVFAILKFYRLI